MRLRSLSLAGMVAVLLLPAHTATAAEIIKDGSFEGTPASEDNPNWSEGGVAPPICDVDLCGNGEGTAGPHTGNNWAYFSGVPTPDLQSITQQITIPSGSATLSFWLWHGRSNGGGLDTLGVYIGGDQLFQFLEGSPGYGNYTQVTVEVAQYAGAGPQDLDFLFDGLGGVPYTTFSVDDISLQAGPLSPKSVTLKGPKAVDRGKKAKLTATVQPCLGHEGDTIELFRGKKKVTTVASDAACTAKFKVKIKKTASFTAASPKQDADHEAGTSKKLKVRAKS